MMLRVVLLLLLTLSLPSMAQEAPGETFNLGAWPLHDSVNVSITGDSPSNMWLAVEVAGDPDLGLDWSERGLALVQVNFTLGSGHPNFAQWKLIQDPEALPGEGMYPSIVSPGPNVVTLAGKTFLPIPLGIFGGVAWIGPGQMLAYRQRKGTNLYLSAPTANLPWLDPAWDSRDAKPHLARDFRSDVTHLCWTRDDPASSDDCRAQDVVSVAYPMRSSPPPPQYIVSAANGNGVAAEEDHCMMDFMPEAEQDVRYTVFHRQNLCSSASGDHQIRLDIVSFDGTNSWTQISDFPLVDATGSATPDGDFPSIYIRLHQFSPWVSSNRATVLVAAQERGALDQDRVLLWECQGQRSDCDTSSDFSFDEFIGGPDDTFFDPKIFAVQASSFAALPSAEHQFIVFTDDADSGDPDSDHDVRILAKCSGGSWSDHGRLPIDSIGLSGSRTWLGTPPAQSSLNLSAVDRDPPSASQASVFVANDQEFFVSFLAESTADADLREVLLYKGTVSDFCP